jgi:hypothetical protein
LGDADGVRGVWTIAQVVAGINEIRAPTTLPRHIAGDGRCLVIWQAFAAEKIIDLSPEGDPIIISSHDNLRGIAWDGSSLRH